MARKPASYDLDLVRSAAARRWPEILSRVGGVAAELLDGAHHPCPRCGGHDRFRMIDADAGSLFCNQCFNKKNGDGFAAVMWLRGVKLNESIKLIAKYLGVGSGINGKQHSSTPEADPAEHLDFQPWHDGLANTWCVLHKPGILPAAMVAAGCRLARYRNQHTVFAFPIWGEKLDQAKAVGWCLYSVSGGTLPAFNKDAPPSYIKTKTTYGSKRGLIGPVELIANAHTIWKLEGPTDMLAMLSLNDLPAGVVPIANANGTAENPPWWVILLFSGKLGYVLHDADEPGEAGSETWSNEITKVASECFRVRLPYPVSKDHGKDLRDFLGEL